MAFPDTETFVTRKESSLGLLILKSLYVVLYLGKGVTEFKNEGVILSVMNTSA